MLSAKNAWPSAVSMVCDVTSDSSGLSRKVTPSMALGRVSERMASSRNRMNSAGIR